MYKKIFNLMSPRQNYFFDRIKVLLNNNNDEIKTYKIKRKNKYYPPLYSLFKSPSNIIFLCVIYYCCVSLILAGADCTHLHSRSLLNFCLLFLIMLQAAFTSALISFPLNVLYNPRLILFPLNSYLFCFF